MTAEAGSQPMPSSPIIAFASAISCSVTCSTSPRTNATREALSATRAGADLNRRGQRIRVFDRLQFQIRFLNVVAPRPHPIERVGAFGLDDRDLRHFCDHAEFQQPVEAFAIADELPILPPGTITRSGASPSALLRHLERDRLLTFQTKRVDRVEQIKPRPVRHFAHQPHRVVEIAVDLQHDRAVIERLREFAERDLARRDEDERLYFGARGYAAIEADVLPVLAQATPVARSRFACVMPVVIPKSLNDPVGFIPRCLNDRRFILAYAADRGASQIGVLPSTIVTILASSASGSSSR